MLALLADGRLDEHEIDALDRQGIFADLGIARSAFVEVLSDFCSDVARAGCRSAATATRSPRRH
ncbi:MAG: hypothetical protein MZW92_60100 [Comamonadaceae bacterium]|nr:hypothetical protein [Comamonadaceae bacterium]